jgi:hypothetical protein
MASLKEVVRVVRGSYLEDGLFTTHTGPFLADPRFQAAYGAGDIASPGHSQWRWRVHVGLWAAELAAGVPGDFVECGVNRGFLSTAIMEYLGWNAHRRTFYLFDSFDGVKEDLLTAEERAQGRVEAYRRAKQRNEVAMDVEEARRTFARWERVQIVPGFVPGTLTQVSIEAVAFLHLDMNSAVPEHEAATFFWPRIVEGGVVLMDDYCNSGYPQQHEFLTKFAASVGASILALPTGQGLIVKRTRAT